MGVATRSSANAGVGAAGKRTSTPLPTVAAKTGRLIRSYPGLATVTARDSRSRRPGESPGDDDPAVRGFAPPGLRPAPLGQVVDAIGKAAVAAGSGRGIVRSGARRGMRNRRRDRWPACRCARLRHPCADRSALKRTAARIG
jgi:hypothetical protein